MLVVVLKNFPENLSKIDAQILEQTLIEEYNTTDPSNGYNTTKGGDGGDTGRNGEINKRKKHSRFMKKLYEHNPDRRENVSQKVKQRHQKRIKEGKLEEFRQKCSQASRHGKEHQNHTGLWVVRFNKYETIKDAAISEKLNPWTINEYCNNPDKKFTRNCVLGEKGQTRREAGFYRIYKEKK